MATADDALKYSGYSEIDFTIKEDAPVYDAVQKFAAFNIGCLVTTDAAGKSRKEFRRHCHAWKDMNESAMHCYFSLPTFVRALSTSAEYNAVSCRRNDFLPTISDPTVVEFFQET